MYIGIKFLYDFRFGKTNPKIAIYLRDEESTGGIRFRLAASRTQFAATTNSVMDANANDQSAKRMHVGYYATYAKNSVRRSRMLEIVASAPHRRRDV